MRTDETERLHREADLDGLVEARMESLAPKLKVAAETLPTAVAEDLKAAPDHPWTTPVQAAAEAIVRASPSDTTS